MKYVSPGSIMRVERVEFAFGIDTHLWMHFIRPAFEEVMECCRAYMFPLCASDAYKLEVQIEEINETTLGEIMYRLRLAPAHEQNYASNVVVLDVLKVTFDAY